METFQFLETQDHKNQLIIEKLDHSYFSITKIKELFTRYTEHCKDNDKQGILSL